MYSQESHFLGLAGVVAKKAHETGQVPCAECEPALAALKLQVQTQLNDAVLVAADK